MRYALAIFFAAILAFSSALAGHNDHVTADAQFDVKVIEPLTVVDDGDIVLDDVIQGQIRNWTAEIITFTISGEPTYPIDVTITGPTANGNNPSGALLLLGAGVSAAPTHLDASGDATVTWTCTGANATNAGTGTYVFSLNVEAKYTGM